MSLCGPYKYFQILLFVKIALFVCISCVDPTPPLDDQDTIGVPSTIFDAGANIEIQNSLLNILVTVTLNEIPSPSNREENLKPGPPMKMGR